MGIGRDLLQRLWVLSPSNPAQFFESIDPAMLGTDALFDIRDPSLQLSGVHLLRSTGRRRIGRLCLARKEVTPPMQDVHHRLQSIWDPTTIVGRFRLSARKPPPLTAGL